MSLVQRAKLILAAHCALYVDVAQFPPRDLVELARIAHAGGTRITFRNCANKAPSCIEDLLAIGASATNLLAFET